MPDDSQIKVGDIVQLKTRPQRPYWRGKVVEIKDNIARVYFGSHSYNYISLNELDKNVLPKGVMHE